jgi:hypothetical protein
VSVNPVAFKWLRQRAYGFADKHGRDHEALHRFCREQVQEWRRTDPEGGDLSGDAGERLACDVARWVAEKYRPKKKRPKSTRTDRSVQQGNIRLAIEFLKEDGERPSVRNVAKVWGYSKSKAARLMKAEGIAPRREAVVSGLSVPAQRLFRVLELNVPRARPTVIAVEPLIRYIWSPHPVIDTKKSALSMQRKRFKGLVEEITDARLGYYTLRHDDVIAVRYGRPWSRLEDAVQFIEAFWRGPNIRPPRLPPASRPLDADVGGLFWQHPEIELCVSVMRLTRQYDFMYVTDALPFIEMMEGGNVYRDKILRAVARAMGSGRRCVDYLFRMSEFYWNKDRAFAKAINQFAGIAQEIFPQIRWNYYFYAYDTLRAVLRTSGYLERLEVSDPEAADRIEELLDLIPAGEQLEKTINRFARLAGEEIAERRQRLPESKAIVQRLVSTIPF